ncbi:hypothetical protein D9756_010788 [Leucocoprinus leucothites]|uniref:Uncharacterized protein n=1 Tax=Leucocoprinus leucothites TaxID=201217 RepID=A0A8H5CVK0_9AGAR|nr:hypothetical protein D9756_010788 [Leucoagaricus leucothites]
MLSARASHLALDGSQFPMKTPARGTRTRSENAHQGAMTIQNGKGKANVMRTPFHPKTAQPQRLLKDGPGSTSAKAPIHLITRSNKPLADKTPFANRTLNIYHTPAPDHKPPKLNLLAPVVHDQHTTPDSGPGSARASSTRRHSRAPKPSVAFQTPANQGNHWDVSDGDIVVPEMEQVLEIEEEFDDSEEIEYMPPNTLDLPYHPPFEFDLPDYKLLGQAALRSVYTYVNEELPAPTFDFTISDQDLMKWDSLSLPSLLYQDESSVFASKSTVKRSMTNSFTATARRHPTIRATSALTSTSRLNSRPTTATSIRPATSASTKTPTAKPSTRLAAPTKTVRVTSTITRPPSTTLRAASSAARQSHAPTTTRITRPQADTFTRAVSTNPSRATTIGKTTGIPAKPVTTTSNRPIIPRRPAAISSTARPASSASALPTTKASAVKPTRTATASRATSAASISRKPPVPRLAEVHVSAVMRAKSSVAASASMKQATASTKISGKLIKSSGTIVKLSKKSVHDVVGPKQAPIVSANEDGTMPLGDQIVEVVVALGEVIGCDAERPEKAEDRGKVKLDLSIGQPTDDSKAIASVLNNASAVGVRENEGDELESKDPLSLAQVSSASDEARVSAAEESGGDTRVAERTVIGSGETR